MCLSDTVPLCPRLMATILSVAQKQYSLLKAANLLTPDMVSEFEELQLLVQKEAAVSPQPTDTSGAPPALRTQRGCDGEQPAALIPVSSGLI